MIMSRYRGIAIAFMVTILQVFFCFPVHASITYDSVSNTITVTGSHTLTDIADADQANNWGVFKKLSEKQFKMDAKIIIGIVGGDSGQLTDDSKQIFITNNVITGEFQKAFGVENGLLRFGFTTDEVNKLGKSGCDIVIDNPYKAYIIHSLDPATCTIELYSTHINNKGSALGSIYVQKGRIWHCILDKTYFLSSYQDEIDIYNMTILHAYRGLSGVVPNDISGLRVIDPIFWGIGLTTAPYAMTLRGGYFRGTQALVRCMATFVGTSISLIDTDTDNWEVSWHSDSSGAVYREYSFNLQVTNVHGNPIQNARVRLVDANNNEVFDVLTDPNGRIAEQIVTRTMCIEGYTNLEKDAYINYSPHTLMIERDDKVRYKSTFVLASPVNWNISLCKGKGKYKDKYKD
jgi:hypothetical protein